MTQAILVGLLLATAAVSDHALCGMWDTPTVQYVCIVYSRYVQTQTGQNKYVGNRSYKCSMFQFSIMSLCAILV